MRTPDSLPTAPAPAFPGVTPRPWYRNESVDLERWLPALTSSPLEGQDNPAYQGEGLVCAFDEQEPPGLADGRFLLAAVNSHEDLLAFVRDACGPDGLGGAGHSPGVAALLRRGRALLAQVQARHEGRAG